jgi:outer membrane protein OmpA-like peptidoglycan-associated protein
LTYFLSVGFMSLRLVNFIKRPLGNAVISRKVSSLALVLTVFSASSLAVDGCPPEAVELYQSGELAVAERRLEDARPYFEEAAGLCDKAKYWQSLGEVLFELQLAPNVDGETEDGDPSLEAFGNAFAIARRSQDDEAGAAAARSIVELGLRAGDPLKAQNWLLIAQDLDPDHPDIPELQQAVDSARLELSANEIDTGFSQTRGLGRVNNLLGGGVTATAFWEAAGEPEGTVSQLEVDPLDGSQGGGGQATVSIPINFKINSTEVTPDTASNVENLAKVLADQPKTVSVLLIGHADERGDDAYNLQLSSDRAQEIRLTLVGLEPSLEGRVRAMGVGETRPIDEGNTERAHANNRRLEVTLSGSGSDSD